MYRVQQRRLQTRKYDDLSNENEFMDAEDSFDQGFAKYGGGKIVTVNNTNENGNKNENETEISHIDCVDEMSINNNEDSMTISITNNKDMIDEKECQEASVGNEAFERYTNEKRDKKVTDSQKKAKETRKKFETKLKSDQSKNDENMNAELLGKITIEDTSIATDNDNNDSNDNDNDNSIVNIDGICAICRDDLQGQVRILDCKHYFCIDCIRQWEKEGNDLCPICRSNTCRNKYCYKKEEKKERERQEQHAIIVFQRQRQRRLRELQLMRTQQEMNDNHDINIGNNNDNNDNNDNNGNNHSSRTIIMTRMAAQLPFLT